MLGLRQKLSLGFGGLLLIIMIIGVQSIVQFRDLGQSIDVILRENYRSVVACQDMKEALERMNSGILSTFLGYQREGTEQIRQNEMVFEKALQIELNNITVPGEAEKAAALKALFTRYLATLHEVEKQTLPMDVRRHLYFKEILPLFQQVKSTADEVLQMNQNNMNEANDAARKDAASARHRMYIFLLFGVFVAIAFMLFIGKWILRPIHRLILSTEEIRSGNLDLIVQADSHDEIGRLSEAFNAMAVSLREFRRSDQAKLVRTEQATKEAFNKLPDAVAVVDLDGKVEISTASARNLFGLKPGVHLQEVPVAHLNHLFQDIFKDDFLKYKEKQKLFQLFVNGEERYFHMDAVPMTDRDGHLTGVILVLKD